MTAEHVPPFGQLLQTYRALAGMTQEELAERASYSVDYISKLERGLRRPSPRLVPVLVAALNLGAADRDRFEAAAASGERSGTAEPEWPVLTSLSPPAAPLDHVARERLVTAVRVALETHRLVLISAPAGSGKSTLAAEMLRSSPGLPFAWISLDDEDNDVVRFLGLLVAALGRLDALWARTASILLREAGSPGAHARRVIGALINDMVEVSSPPVVLVLDDLHRITEPAVYVALDYLLERLPPQLRLLVATRHDPPLALARLRARGELAELRFADLRFSPDEVAAVLAGRLRSELSAVELETVCEQTEGWAAGVRLLATVLAGVSEPRDRAGVLTGASRADRYMFDFLSEEVLDREAPEVRTFMLETSILGRLTPALCRAVTGRTDAAALLDDLERRNLFVAALDEPGAHKRTLRYHDLFAAVLRQRLRREAPDRLAALHRRAAEAEPSAGDAIGHLLAGELWDEAAERIEAVGEALLRQGLRATLRGWIESLPPAVRERRACLLYLLGLTLWSQGEIPQACAFLRQAVPGLAGAGDGEREGEALALLSSAALLRGDNERSDELAERALGLPLPPESRVQLLLDRVRIRLMRGEWARASADLDAALQVGQGAPSAAVVAGLVTHLHPVFAAEPGGVARVERICALARPHLHDAAGPARVAYEAQSALVHFWRGRFDRVPAAAEQVLSLRDRYGSDNPFLDIWVIGAAAAVHVARGEAAEAERYFALDARLSEQVGLAQTISPAALFARGRARWLQRRYEEAAELHAEMLAVATPEELPIMPALRATLDGLVQMARGQHEAALLALRRAVEIQDRVPPVVLFVNARLFLAHLYLLLDRQADALSVLAPALKSCERENVPGFVLREGPWVAPLLRLAIEKDLAPAFAARLLALMGLPMQPQPMSVPGTGETLSGREVELLRLLANGASNREIAAQLVISDQTVKTHISHILRKLGVASRTAAAARGRELHIL